MKKILLVGLLFLHWHAYAQIPLSHEVKEAIHAALQKDVTWQNNQLEKEKLALAHQKVTNTYLPHVTANGLYGYVNSEASLDLPTLTLPLTGTNLWEGSTPFSTEGQVIHGGIMAKSVLFTGGQIHNAAKALAYKNQGTSYLLDLRVDEVIKDVLLSFDQLTLCQQAAILLDESEKRLHKEAERVDRAILSGLAIPYDREKIKLALLELASKRVDLLNKQQLLALKLHQATGIAPEDLLLIPHQVSPIFLSDALNESFTSENRNEVKALSAFQQAASYALKKEKGTFWPSVAAFGGYSYTSLFNNSLSLPIAQQTLSLNTNALTFHPTFMLGIGLKWEIFSGFTRKHNLQEAKINSLQIENQWKDALEKTHLELEKNKKDYETAQLQLNIAKQRLVIAQNNQKMAEQQYQAGLIGVTERLAAENEWYKEALHNIETILQQRKIALNTYQSAGLLQTLVLNQYE